MDELWIPVRGWEDRYMISNTGKVYSIKTDKEIGSSNHNGYLFVKLYTPEYSREITIHRLMAENFLLKEELPVNIVVHHKDFNKTNNNLDNLQLMTRQEHMKIHSKDGSRKNKATPIKLYDAESGNYIKSYTNMTIAANELDITVGEISRAVNNGYRVKDYKFSTIDAETFVVKPKKSDLKPEKETIKVYDEEGIKVGEFNTLQEVGDFINRSREAVRIALKQNRPCNGFTFIKN